MEPLPVTRGAGVPDGPTHRHPTHPPGCGLVFCAGPRCGSMELCRHADNRCGIDLGNRDTPGPDGHALSRVRLGDGGKTG